MEKVNIHDCCPDFILFHQTIINMDKIRKL